MPDYDYSQSGAYFVTIVAYRHICVLGKVNNGHVHLSKIGKIVEETWREIPSHFPHVTNEHFVIMPNHLHGIIIIEDSPVGATHGSPNQSPNKAIISLANQASLGAIVGSFKSAVTREIHQIKGLEDFKVWQRNYYEHIIRN